MRFPLRLLRGALRSRALRAVTASLIEDHRERHDSCVAVAVEAAVVNQTPGDYLEFGVHTGRSFVRAFERYERMRRTLLGYRDFQSVPASRLPAPMRFFAFDAFDRGFPEPEGPDATELRPLHWEAGGMVTTEAEFVRSCHDARLDMDRVVVVPGYFEETATDALKSRHRLERAAVAHFDCDLYGSTRDALAFTTSLTQLGSVYIFDDYFRFRGSERHGQYRAFEEWRKRHPNLGFRELARYRANSVAFICSRVDGESG